MGQEPVLFARSVAENIAYGLDKCTIVEVSEQWDPTESQGSMTLFGHLAITHKSLWQYISYFVVDLCPLF